MVISQNPKKRGRWRKGVEDDGAYDSFESKKERMTVASRRGCEGTKKQKGFEKALWSEGAHIRGGGGFTPLGGKGQGSKAYFRISQLERKRDFAGEVFRIYKG